EFYLRRAKCGLKDIRKLLFSMAVLSYIRIINLRKGVGKAMLDHFTDA
ncbi:hypothetical protein HMPREF3213_01710, partial [Heyndrickxia coagulans]